MLTILFDGIAYGMLLFVLACGLAVTLGLMNFVNLAHGAFAMAGGYVTAVLTNRYGVPFLATLPLAFLVPAPARAAARADALSSASTRAATSTRCCSRSASSSWPSRRSTISWARSSSSSSCRRWLQGRVDVLGVGRSASTAASSSSSAACSSSRCSSSCAHALRQPAARGGRRSARGARPRHQRRPRSSPPPSPSAPASPGSAARSAPRSSGSIRPFR